MVRCCAIVVAVLVGACARHAPVEPVPMDESVGSIDLEGVLTVLRPGAVGSLDESFWNARTVIGVDAAPSAAWTSERDETASSRAGVFAVRPRAGCDGRGFNTLVAPSVSAADVVVAVSLKPMAGEMDRGGGVMWRVQGNQAYYLCRANPLENNIRLYVVEGGVRTMIRSERVSIDDGWHDLVVRHIGDRIRVRFDDVSFEVRDALIPGPGAVGLWTKSDAATRFSPMRVTSLYR